MANVNYFAVDDMNCSTAVGGEDPRGPCCHTRQPSKEKYGDGRNHAIVDRELIHAHSCHRVWEKRIFEIRRLHDAGETSRRGLGVVDAGLSGTLSDRNRFTELSRERVINRQGRRSAAT
jgi:hypothetical protein